MAEEKDDSVRVREQGFLKIRLTTAMILAGIIFLATLLAGFLNQNKDVSTVQAEQKALHERVNQHDSKIAVTETYLKGLCEDMNEIKKDVKDLGKSQAEFMREMALAHKGVKP